MFPNSTPYRKPGLHLQNHYFPNSPGMLQSVGTPQHPMTPMDFSYSQSMLPANLLSTPSPYVGNGHNFMPPVLSPSLHPRRHFSASSLVATPPLFSPHQGNFDLQLPRTVIFSGLPSNVTLSMFLDHLGFGPVEQCRMVSGQGSENKGPENGRPRSSLCDISENGTSQTKEPSKGVSDSNEDNSELGEPKEQSENTIFVSFLNHPTALHCLNRYSQNSEDLRQKLNCPNLKMSFDSPETARGLKLKVFKYVVEHDATRAISICFRILDSDLVPLMEKSFRARCSNFGDVEDFVAVEADQHIEYVVHFLSVESAIKIYDYHKRRLLRNEPVADEDVELSCMSVAFHRDRCESLDFCQPPVPESERSLSKDSMTNELSLHGMEEPSDVSSNSAISEFNSPNHFHLDIMGVRDAPPCPFPMPQPPFSQFPSFPYNPDPMNDCNRTLCLGNLQPKTTVEEIANNVRAGGLVESIKFYRYKRVCFITFVDPKIALKFYLNHQVLHQLVIRDNVISVNWGRNHSGPLPVNIANAVKSGASRNVYIGLKLNKSKIFKYKLPDEATLRADFSHFGDLEQINYVHNKDCGFMNFMNINDAIKVVSYFESNNKKRISEIVGDNGEVYEKYRIFKISFGKDRCGNPLKFSFKKTVESEREPERPKKQPESKSAESINQEAAMVFGIQTPAGNGNKAQKEKKMGKNGKKAGNEGNGKNENGENGEDGEDGDSGQDSESEADDIAIIIEPDTPSRPQPPKTRKKAEKVYHDDNVDLTELLSVAWSSKGYGYGYQAPMYAPPMINKEQYEAMGQAYASQHNYSGSYGSGSQIMAQYLAKSQHETALLASTVHERRKRNTMNES